jgi:hypothetical protein
MTADMKKSLEIARKAGRSLQRAVDLVVEEHKKNGDPLVVVHTGRASSKDPHHTMAVHEDAAPYKTKKRKQ